jgi:hypothetical protein
MKKGTGQKGGTSGGRRVLWWIDGAAERNGVGGSEVGTAWREGTGEREGPGHDGGQLGRPAMTPSRRARAVPLPRDRGGRRGAGDSARGRGRLTSGARRQRGPVVSGGVREGEEKMRQRGGGH